MEIKMPYGNNQQTKKINLVLVAVAAVTVLVAIVLLVSTMMKFNDRQEEINKLKAEKAALENKVEELEDELDAVVDDDYIASVAKDKLGMYFPDEVIYYEGQTGEAE